MSFADMGEKSNSLAWGTLPTCNLMSDTLLWWQCFSKNVMKITFCKVVRFVFVPKNRCIIVIKHLSYLAWICHDIVIFPTKNDLIVSWKINVYSLHKKTGWFIREHNITQSCFLHFEAQGFLTRFRRPYIFTFDRKHIIDHHTTIQVSDKEIDTRIWNK